MVKCGEPGCSEVFANGRGRRRHVHTVHRTLTDICVSCNNEPFLTPRALQQHIDSGHMNLNKPRRRRSKRRGKSQATVLSANLLPLSAFGNSYIEHNSANVRRFDVIQAFSSVTLDSSSLFTISSESELNSFIANTVQPNHSFLKTCGEAIDEVVNFLQHNAPANLRPDSVFKGGSLCKGTAVKGKTDVDMAVMLNGYNSVPELVENMDSVLRDLKNSLRGCPNIDVSRHTTHRCVQITISAGGERIEADLLPTVDILKTRTPVQVFDEMKGKPDKIRGFYSPCIAPLQKQLFEGVPTSVKSLIRLLKYWKKEELQGTERDVKWPASYALELIVLDSWIKAGKPTAFNTARALHSVLTALANHRSFRIKFPGDIQMYPDRFLNLSTTRTPYIMDPCNPFNNVYYKGAYDWEKTATKANYWLSKPLLSGIRGTSTVW